MGPFECIGGMYALFILYFLHRKSSITFSQDVMENSELSSIEQEMLINLSFCDIMAIARSSLGLFAQFICYFGISFFSPLINSHLDDLGYSPAFLGLTLVIVTLAYSMTIVIIDYITDRF